MGINLLGEQILVLTHRIFFGEQSRRFQTGQAKLTTPSFAVLQAMLDRAHLRPSTAFVESLLGNPASTNSVLNLHPLEENAVHMSIVGIRPARCRGDNTPADFDPNARDG